jgi:hypothetical protein
MSRHSLAAGRKTRGNIAYGFASGKAFKAQAGLAPHARDG